VDGGGRGQLEQSDLRLALNMAKMAKGEFAYTALEETLCPIVRTHTPASGGIWIWLHTWTRVTIYVDV